MLNRIVMIGRLTKDVEMRITPAGTNVSTFTIACDRDRKGKDGQKETDFVNVVVWGKTAEICATYLAKGKMCSVDGRLQIRQYEKDGQKRSIAEIAADGVQFLSPREATPTEMPTEEEMPF